jgi:hypothetical protein
MRSGDSMHWNMHPRGLVLPGKPVRASPVHLHLAEWKPLGQRMHPQGAIRRFPRVHSAP